MNQAISRLGEESLSPLAGPRPRLGCHSANRSSGRSSGPNEGLWSSAASAFELLAAGLGGGCDRRSQSGPVLPVDRRSRRRPSPRFGDTSRAPAPRSTPWSSRHSARGSNAVAPYDQVDFVHLSWPIRNRDGLLAALRGNKLFDGGPKIDLSIPTIPSLPRSRGFSCSIGPRSRRRPASTRRKSRWSMGELLVSPDTVILETYDDGRLDRLVDRFTAAAGANIPPAHPRTKIIGKEQRHLLALSLALAAFPKE